MLHAHHRDTESHLPAVDLAIDRLVEELFAPGWTTLRTEDGAELRAERVATYRNVTSVLAPRLALEPELLVNGACLAPDPWAVTFVVREVVPYSASSESVVLEAVESSLYPERRRERRVEAGGEAIVTIHHGVEMVEQERVRAVLVNVSEHGLAFATGADLAPGTHVTVDARPLFGRLCADVVIRWRGPSVNPDMQLYGCRVQQVAEATSGVLRRLVEGDRAAEPEPAPAMSIAELRESLTPQGSRRFLRRRS
jgi:hypothetical protein